MKKEDVKAQDIIRFINNSYDRGVIEAALEKYINTKTKEEKDWEELISNARGAFKMVLEPNIKVSENTLVRYCKKYHPEKSPGEVRAFFNIPWCCGACGQILEHEFANCSMCNGEDLSSPDQISKKELSDHSI